METWVIFKAFKNRYEAELEASLLESHGVPVELQFEEPIPGLIGSVYILLPLRLAHRARWVLAGVYEDLEQSVNIISLPM